MNPANAQNPLDSRQLHAFASLARTGSFTETARELFLTHSAISHAMSALQSQVGCRLLTRAGKKVQLTQEGEAFLHHAKHGLDAFAKARQTIEDMKQWGAQRLRFGAGASICRILLPAVLTEMRRQYPRLMFSAALIHPWEVPDALERGELEFALGEPPRKFPQLEFTHLLESPLKLVVASSHPWAETGRPSSADLAKEPCFLTSRSHPTRQTIDTYLGKEKISLKHIVEIESFDAIKELVCRGFGASLLPQWAIKTEINRGELVAFAPGRRRLVQEWGLLRWKGRPVNVVENTFRSSCIAAAKTLQ